MKAKAEAKARAKEEERLRKAVESRDSRLATLVHEKQRLTEEAEQRQREVCIASVLMHHQQMLWPSVSVFEER